MEEINLQTLNDYDGKWHSKNFNVTLTTTNAIGGVFIDLQKYHPLGH